MTKIIQLPRPLPEKRWSPSEILALKEPADSRAKYRQERSTLGATEAVAANATNREKRKAKRKKAIVDTLADQRPWTVGLSRGGTQLHWRGYQSHNSHGSIARTRE